MVYRIALIFILLSCVPVILQYFLTADDPDPAIMTAALVSGFPLSAISLAGVLIIGKKLWFENNYRGKNLLFLQALIVGALFPFLYLILIYMLGGFSIKVIMVPWPQTLGETIMVAFMGGWFVWAFSMPWAFAVNYLMMKEILRDRE